MYDNNQMQANPGKFQAIVCGKKPFLNSRASASLVNINIPCEETVKFLGVELDYQLNFRSPGFARK